MNKDEKILKLHMTPEGVLWAADGIRSPEVVAEDLSTYVRNLACQSRLHVRVVGMATNARLLTSLFAELRDCPTAKLEVATPDICENDAERADPSVVLYRMRQCLRSASLGGWHNYTPDDDAAYQLITRRGDMTGMLAALQTHAAFYDLQFIPTLQVNAAAEVLATIVDPKWHIDLWHPERLCRLRMFLGLTPRNVHAALRGKQSGVKVQRCMQVIQAWGGDRPAPLVLQPADFLWQRYLKDGGGVKGVLRASDAFITYCVRTWEQQRLRRAGSPIEIFIPDALLRPVECDAYKAYSAARSLA